MIIDESILYGFLVSLKFILRKYLEVEPNLYTKYTCEYYVTIATYFVSVPITEEYSVPSDHGPYS